jgi:hypothetical protein
LLKEKIMRANYSRLILPAAVFVALFGAACGSVATPEWAAEAQGTQIALAATSEHLTAIAPTNTPTNTPVPPTATNTPIPTATIAPTDTPMPPTEMPTEEATVVPPTESPADEVAVGDPSRGQSVFQTPHVLPDGSQWACMSCHSVTPDEMMLIGPGLYNVSVRALTYPGVTDPIEYIHDSIVNPQDFIAPHPAGAQWPLQMPEGWEEALSQQELDDVVAYLLTLQDE